MEGNCSSPVHRWRSISGFSSIEGSINALSIKVEHKKGLPGDGLGNLPFWVQLFLLALFTSGLSGSVGKLCNELGFFFKTNLFLVLLHVPGNSLLSIEEMDIRAWILNVIRLIIITISSKFHLKTHKNHKTKNRFNGVEHRTFIKIWWQIWFRNFFPHLILNPLSPSTLGSIEGTQIFFLLVLLVHIIPKYVLSFCKKKVNWQFKLICLQTTGNIFFWKKFFKKILFTYVLKIEYR